MSIVATVQQESTRLQVTSCARAVLRGPTVPLKGVLAVQCAQQGRTVLRLLQQGTQVHHAQAVPQACMGQYQVQPHAFHARSEHTPWALVRQMHLRVCSVQRGPISLLLQGLATFQCAFPVLLAHILLSQEQPMYQCASGALQGSTPLW